MNPVTFNDAFLKFCAKTSGAGIKAKCRQMAESPLIKWEEPTEEDFKESDFPEAFFPNSCPRLPFEYFRVDGFYHYRGPGFIKFKAWVTQDGMKSNSPGFSMAFQFERTDAGMVRNVLMLASAIFPKQNAEIGHPEIRWVFTHFDVEKGLPLKLDMHRDAMWPLCGEWLTKLCIDFYNPNLYLCKKHPPIPAGKSIVWQKAREHYVLLHKTHAANKLESVGKKTIQDDQFADRVAHSRRAHFRLLRSPRFRHKQGQRVWVQSAWIGPKEWTDRSGQIYRIVERHNISPQ